MRPTWLLLASHVPADGRGGGMVRYAVELARALVESDAVELHVVADPGAQSFWESIVAAPGQIHPMVRAPVVVRSLLERRGLGSPAFGRSFDVVHGTKHLLPAMGGGTSVLTVHDFLPMDRPGDFGVLKRTFLPGAYLSSIQRADVLLCVSEATRDRLISYVPEARSRAHVVPLAGTSLHAEEPEAVPELEGRRFALVVGDDSARKNVSFVKDLWPEVSSRHPGSVLALVGPAAWKPEQRADSVAQDVVRPGYLSQGQLAWAYRNASVVLCPSRLEGFGLPAREAVDLRVPVITSEDPALCEVSGQDATHLPTRDRDAWIRAICSSLDQQPETDRGGMPVRTWDDVAHQTLEVVTGVFDSANR